MMGCVGDCEFSAAGHTEAESLVGLGMVRISQCAVVVVLELESVDCDYSVEFVVREIGGVDWRKRRTLEDCTASLRFCGVFLR